MKCKGVLVLGLVVLATATLQAQLPSSVPSFDLTVFPANPTSGDTVNVSLSTLWPNSCVPLGTNTTVADGSIEIEMRMPDTFDCNAPAPVCEPIPVAFGFSTSVGPLTPGTYTVSVEFVSCDATSGFTSVGSFTVGLPTGGPPAGGNGNGAPRTLAPGTTVVLLQNNGSLRAGQAGTVICCDAQDCGGRVLVSWFLNTQGNGTTADCADNTPRIVPPASATWVDPTAVPIGVAFNQCGTLDRNAEGCFVLAADDGGTYILTAGSWLPAFLGPAANFDLGDRVRVQGLVSVKRPAGAFFPCAEQAGDIYHPVITPCALAGGGNGNGNGNGTGCCAQNFRPGDRVRLLINNPPDLLGHPTSELVTGALGTVVCCGAVNDDFRVFVSWDGLTTGNNMHFLCSSSPTLTYPDSSGWWMRCSDLALLAGGNGDGNGTGPLCPNDNLSVSFGSSGVRLIRDPLCPTTPRAFSGCTTVTIQANFRAQLSLRVTPQPGITGTWTGTITPNIVPAGQTSVQVCVNATDVGLSNIPIGRDVQVATVSVAAVPAP